MKVNFNKLQDIDKNKTPFKVPDNYFENFNEEIMNLLPEKEFQAPVKITMWDRAKPWVYMAAMFLGLYFMINFLTNNNGAADVQEPVVAEQSVEGATSTSSYWSTVHITEEEFYNYLEDQLIDDGYYDYMYDQYYLN
ncbi:MAG TPA: hypothetical protein GX712_00885 [Bacteroidales bacterium]|nr:hypothetical protein [Bacteroidales bacterium]